MSLQFLISLALPDQAVIDRLGTKTFHTQPQAPGLQDHLFKLEEKAVQPQIEWVVHSLSQIW